MTRIFLILFFVSSQFFAIIGQAGAETAFFGDREELTVETGAGTFTFMVEVADTNEKRSRGLMFREQMDATHGMLFDFKTVAPVSMWMANTILSLDMVFIKPDGMVLRIERDTVPYSREIITSGGPVSYVLELNAGIARQIGLKPGDTVKHRLIGLPD